MLIFNFVVKTFFKDKYRSISILLNEKTEIYSGGIIHSLAIDL
jgi:hypothetical protein